MARRVAACVRRLRFHCALPLLVVLATPASAQSGVLFADDFESGFGQWTENASGGDASIGGETGASGSSMRLRWGVVSAVSDSFDAAVSAAELTLWIRRGDDSFSEDPDPGEDLSIEYQNSGGNWITIDSYTGNGNSGQIFTPTYALPADALHGNLRIRFRLTGGNGSDNDYWHVDDVLVSGGGASLGGFGLGSCENFEGGMAGWQVTGSSANVGVSSATANSPTQSLFTRFGGVTAISPTVDLTAQVSVDLTLWIRRGHEPYSKKPEDDENMAIEYLDSLGNWVLLEQFAGKGTPRQAYSRTYPLPQGAFHSAFAVRFRHQGTGEGYWHYDDVCLTGEQVFFYRFEDTTWTGAAGEVQESGGSGLDGTVFGGATNDDADPALATNPGTCRYADFDGVNDYIEVADDPALDFSGALTASAWIYMRSYPNNLHTIISKDWNYEFHVNPAGQVYYWWNDAAGTTRSLTTNSRIVLNRWYHVAVTYESGQQVIYVDGTPWATASYTGSLRLNDLPLFIGTDYNFIARAFDGYIDEVHLTGRVYTQAEVQALRDATHPCATVAVQFTINHDTFGINCLPETIAVNVIDSVAGTPLINYNAQIQLDTQSGNGTWTLLSGSGAFSDPVADDGVAYYDWPLGESQALFQLYYPQGNPVIDIDTFQRSNNGIRDTDAEGLLSFSPDGFTVTAAPLANPPGVIVPFATAQTAAIPFDAYITAYGQTATDPVCGIIESYSGNKNLKFWSDYLNPAGGFRSLDVNGVAAATAEGAATTQPVVFSNGQASVTLKYKDAGSIRVSMKDDTLSDPVLPTGIRGATAAFVSRPADFLLSGILDASGAIANPAAVDAAGPVFVGAGADFQVTVTAIDAEGDATPNFGREATAASVELESLLMAPAGGRNPAIAFASGFGTFANGVATGLDFNWSEVGIVQLRPSVAGGDYLGAGDVIGTDSPNVGRFVPDHFTLALNSPVFNTQCTAGGFTYTGESFDYLTAPLIAATARSVRGATTQNYTGSFFKMTTSTLRNMSYAAATGVLDTSAVPSAATDPVVTDATAGVARIQFDASGMTALSFSRATIDAPFDAAISLSIDVLDGDNIAAAGNPAVFGGISGIAFSSGPSVRYGRLRFVNAVGSELVDLPMPLVAEYYSGTASGFVPSVADSCTGGVSLGFLGYTGNLSAGETCVLDAGAPGASGAGCAVAAPIPQQFASPPASGDFNLILQRPGSGNAGSVIVNSTVPAWLRFDWNAALPGDENPAGIAAFGLYGGDGTQIYLRELY